jgi:hypothetical protein
VKGYSINQQRFKQNAVELQHAMALIQKAAQSPSMETDMGRGLVDILSQYTQTFLWLQQYDEGLLKEPEGQNGGTLAKPDDAMNLLAGPAGFRRCVRRPGSGRRTGGAVDAF